MIKPDVTGNSEQWVQDRPNLTRVNAVSRVLSPFIETELSTVWLVMRLKRVPVLGKRNKKAELFAESGPIPSKDRKSRMD